MPPAIKFFSYAIALTLGALSVSVALRIRESESKLWLAFVAALLVLAAVGLLRRLVWGRMLVSFVAFVISFFLFALLIPIPDDNVDGGPLLQRLLGSMPPTWVAWLFVVLISSAPLVLAVVVSWRRSWFRSEVW